METDFAQLSIDGAVISEFKVVPSKKLVMTLLRRQQDGNERIVQAECDLQFNGVRDFKIDLQSEPWLQVISHAVFSESEYLRKLVADKDLEAQSGKPSHFEVICGKGKFDIIAMSITFSLFNEIPYVEQLDSANE